MLDPRTRLALTFYGAIIIIMSGALKYLSFELGFLIIWAIILRQGLIYLRWLKLVLPMSLFFGAVTWWTAGLLAGEIAALKLLTLTTIFFIFFIFQEPEDLANSLVKAKMPYPIAFVMAAALQFVPVIRRRAKAVIDAQRSRGIPIYPGWAVFRHYPAFLMPLLIQAFQMAEEMAEAMEARGFSRPGRTFYKKYQLKILDWVLIAGGLFGLLGLLGYYCIFFDLCQ